MLSTITDTDLVVARGYNSLLFSTIDSNELKRMKVRVDGLNAGYGASVVCRGTSNCKLICGGTGCDNLDFYCFDGADCTVTPSSCMDGKALNSVATADGVTCPTVKYSKSKKEDRALENDLEKRYHKIESDEYYIEWLSYLDEDMTLWRQREEEFRPLGDASKAGNARILASSTSGPAMFAHFGHHLQFSMDSVAIVLVVIFLILAAFGFVVQCQICQHEAQETVSYEKV